MELIREFKKISRNDAAIAGGKGASLGEMTQAGIPVPPGYVILSAAFEKFLDATDLNVEIDAILHTVKLQEMHTVEDASAQIQALILSAEMPREIALEIQKFYKELNAEFVAVRSSATAEDSAAAAWAGQLDSFLNTTEKTLLDNVRKCWASLFTPRAIFYRFEKNLHEQKISVAVVVQKMVASEVSGIAFSVHPVTQDYNQLIIESGFGLGEAIVSGQITPDSYVVEKVPRRIIDKNISAQARGLYRAAAGGNEWRDLAPEIGERQVLLDEQIMELSEIILTIENHYGFPCDIEWAREGGKFYIVQSRPITTLKPPDSGKKDDLTDTEKGVVKISEKEDDINEGIRDDLKRFTSQNTSLEHADALPVYFEMTMAGFTDKLKNNHLSSYEIGVSHFNKDETDYLSLIPDQQKIGREIIHDYLTDPANIRNLYQEWLVGFEKMLERFETIFDYDFKAFSDEKLLALSEDVYSFYRDEVSMPGFLDGFMFYAEKRLNELLMGYCEFNKIKNFTDIFTTLTASTEASFFNEKESDLSQVKDLNSQKRLLKKYAWIKSSYSGYKPYTKENLEAELKDLKDPALAQNQLIVNKAAKQQLIKKSKFSDEILAIVAITDLFIKWQDQRKVYTLTYVTLRSKILHEIARRYKLDIKLLEYALTPELSQLLNGKLNLDILKGRRNYEFLLIHKNGALQEVITGEAAKSFFAKVQASGQEATAEIYGTTVSKGKASGKVRIVMTAKNIHEVEEGEILVAPMTRPEHLLGMKKAAAIVTDDGGITCHAAIVSRELGKPCIIGTKIATRVLKDGDVVEVDADNGVVKIIKKTAENNESKSGRIFLREHSREYSLFRLETLVWAMNQELQKILGISVAEECAVYRGADLVDIYYEKGALKKLFDGITQSCQDKSEMLKKIAQFLTNFNRLKKLYTGEESLKSVAELKNFQKQYAEVWSYFGILFIIPSLSVDEEIKKAALKARTLTQEYNENPEVVFTKFVEEKFPQVKEKSRFVLPEEIWSGEIESPDILIENKRQGKRLRIL